MNIPRVNLPRVVIVGGGFAGLSVAKRLKECLGQYPGCRIRR